MRFFNYSTLESQKWDSETLDLVAQIREHKGRQSLFLEQRPMQLEKLVEIAKIQSTEASNKIEGIVTTQARIAQLCQDKTTPRNRDEEEIMGYRDVLNTIHENYTYIPLKPSYILQLHRDLYKYSAKTFGGSFKNVQNEIAEIAADGGKRTLFIPSAPHETPAAIESICQEYSRASADFVADNLLLIPMYINDFLCIHPFNDGNGRMSRLLTTLLLYRADFLVGRYISLESKIEKTKAAYYDALAASGIGWHEGNNDVTPFIKYMLRMILSAYRDFEERIDMVREKTPALEQVRRAVEGTMGKFTKNDIMQLTPTIGKASVENSLRTLVGEGVILRHGQGKASFYSKT